MQTKIDNAIRCAMGGPCSFYKNKVAGPINSDGFYTETTYHKKVGPPNVYDKGYTPPKYESNVWTSNVWTSTEKKRASGPRNVYEYK
jgi:hypothetical protein